MAHHKTQGHMTSTLLFRVVLPFNLLLACMFRINLLSLIYLLAALATPLMHRPSIESMKGCTGRFIKWVLPLVAILPILAQCAGQVYFSVYDDGPNSNTTLTNCTQRDYMIHQIGLINFSFFESKPTDVLLCIPAVLVLSTVIWTMVFSIRLNRSHSHHGSSFHDNVMLDSVASDRPLIPEIRNSVHNTKLHNKLSRNKMFRLRIFLCFEAIMLMLAGVVLPNVLTSVYFCLFLAVMTLWGCLVLITPRWLKFRTFIRFYLGLHIMLLYLYQFHSFHKGLHHTSFYARLCGLVVIFKDVCINDPEDTPTFFEFEEDATNWNEHLLLPVLLALHWFMALNWEHWKKILNPVKSKNNLFKHMNQDYNRRNSKWQSSIVDQETGSMVFSGSDIETNAEGVAEEKSRTDDLGRHEGFADEDEIKLSSVNHNFFNSFFYWIYNKSYVLSLIAQMVWSIMYHSWITFCMLLLAYFLWMLPNSRTWCLRTSPFVLCIALCVVTAQFVFAINIKPELPDFIGDITVDDFGLKKSFKYPGADLSIIICCIFFIVLTLRQYMEEPLNNLVTKTSAEETDEDVCSVAADLKEKDNSPLAVCCGEFIWGMLCKYWIILCTSTMLIIIAQEVTIFRIIYMFLFLVFILLFQMYYNLWRRTMAVFWWVCILYSMVVLCAIYTYQFDNIRDKISSRTGLDENVIKAIGLKRLDKKDLFIGLFTPTVFVIIMILQVRYFHKPFLAITSMERFKDTNEDEDSDRMDDFDEEDDASNDDDMSDLRTTKNKTNINTNNETETIVVDQETTRKTIMNAFEQRAHIEGSSSCSAKNARSTITKTSFLQKVLDKIVKQYKHYQHPLKGFQTHLWRVLEMHMFKIVLILIVYRATDIKEASFMALVFMIIICLLLPVSRKWAETAQLRLLLLWTSLTIMMKMVFQLNFLNTEIFHSSCNSSKINPDGEDLSFAPWLGLQKVNTEDGSFLTYIWDYLLILLFIVLDSVVRYHQKQHWNNPRNIRPDHGILFPTIKRQQLDIDLKSSLKYFCNYFFYKFGREMCYIISAIAITVRLDAMAVLYSFQLAIMLLTSRKTNARLYPIYKWLLSLLLPIQFISTIGLPRGLCIIYPWNGYDVNLQRWLFLPSYDQNLDSTLILVNFFQLLFICMQANIFLIENDQERMQQYGGGDNSTLSKTDEGPIPVKDFTVSQRDALDWIKLLIFEHFYWICMLTLFIAGVTRVNIFSMPYIFGVFYFMWFGKLLYLKPISLLLRQWNLMVTYTVFVLLIKSFLQLFGCAFLETLYVEQCWVVQLFGIYCDLDKSNQAKYQEVCTLHLSNVESKMDVVCLGFLLVQRRIFSSYYFRHVIDTCKANSNIVEKGAELMNKIQIRETNRKKEAEKNVLVSLKEKMVVLKQKQADLRHNYIEPEEHYQAIRSGDYYLFDNDEDKEEDVTTLSFPKTKKEKAAADGNKTPDPLQVLNRAGDQGMASAVDAYGNRDDMDKYEEKPVQKKFLSTLWYRSLDWLIVWLNSQTRIHRLVELRIQKAMIVEKMKILLRREMVKVLECNFRRALNKRRLEQKVAEAADEEKRELKTGIKPLIMNTTSQPVTLTNPVHKSALGMIKAQEGLAAKEEQEQESKTLENDETPILKEPSVTSLSQLEEDDAIELAEKKRLNTGRGRQILKALYRLLTSNSERICYMLMILNSMIHGSLISLPLPLMVFLWGMLSVPRPSRTYWITLITYVEGTIVCRYMFKFGFIPWSDDNSDDSPFYPPRIIGIKKINDELWDVIMVMSLFLHRQVMMSSGLWTNTMEKEQEKEKEKEQGMIDESNTFDITSEQPTEDISKTHSAMHSQRAIKGDTIKLVNEEEDEGDADLLDESIFSFEEDEKKRTLKDKVKYLFSPFNKFVRGLTKSTFYAATDVYAFMFFVDFLLFWIVVFGFNAFGPKDETGENENVQNFLQNNKIPESFLIMVLLSFFFIIIDRALYLRKFVLGKFIFNVMLIFFTHGWCFFILPLTTGRWFTTNKVAQVWYFFKCIYFGLASYQIRCGYPNRVLGHFLTKSYGVINLVTYTIFLNIPFLKEIRALMDWTWTDTSLCMGSWLELEDIFDNIFILKCWREMEINFPTLRSQKKSPLVKYLTGGLLIVVIIIVIWCPLLIFSLLAQQNQPNPPTGATMTITITGYEKLYEAKSLIGGIHSLTETEYDNLNQHWTQDEKNLAIFREYCAEDITYIKFEGKGLALWTISPSGLDSLTTELLNNITQQPLTLEVVISFTRKGDELNSDTLSFRNEVDIREMDSSVRLSLGSVLKKQSEERVKMDKVFPRYLFLQNQDVQQNEFSAASGGVSPMGDISLTYRKLLTSPNDVWWDFYERLNQSSILDFGTIIDPVVNEYMSIITFNGKISADKFKLLTQSSILTLYVGFVLVVGRLLRAWSTQRYQKIMFEALPDVDYVLQLCLDIKLAREMKEWKLEEDIYARLSFLYRSPETMIKVTRQTVRLGLAAQLKAKED